jgi:hypothetical protein
MTYIAQIFSNEFVPREYLYDLLEPEISGTSSGLELHHHHRDTTIVHGKGMTCSILHDTSFVLVPRDGRLVFGNDSLVSRERESSLLLWM